MDFNGEEVAESLQKEIDYLDVEIRELNRELDEVKAENQELRDYIAKLEIEE